MALRRRTMPRLRYMAAAPLDHASAKCVPTVHGVRAYAFGMQKATAIADVEAVSNDCGLVRLYPSMRPARRSSDADGHL